MEQFKQALLKYIDRIDVLSLRERVMIFLAAGAVLFLLYDNLLLDPLVARQKELSQQVKQQQGETAAIQQQIQGIALRRGEDPDAVNRDKLQQVRKQLGEVERQLAGRQRSLVTPDRIAALLQNMLRQNHHVELVALRNLPTTELAGGAATPAVPTTAPAAAGSSRPNPGAVQGVYRHGVELTVRGAYLDLLNYIAGLEAMREQIYWGGAELTATGADATLKLTLYTYSSDRTWLTI